jgi:phage terminase large subunit-like protein
MTTSAPSKAVRYDKFLRGGNKKISQDVPVPIRKNHRLVGYEYKSVRLSELLRMIPMYDVFREAEDYYFDLDEMHQFIEFVINECVYPEGELTGLPFIPELWQWAIYFNIFCWKHKETGYRRFKEAFILVPRKNGKALDLNTKIPTPNGYVSIGEITEGQTVFDKDGRQCSVTHVHDVLESPESYEVVFSNGEKVKACADHQWYVMFGEQQLECDVLSTKEIYNITGVTNVKFSVPAPYIDSGPKHVNITSVTPCDPVPMRCITVDSPSRTYLFGETMIATHNTVSFGAIPTLYMFYVDKEQRSQNFCCAADIEQASINFRHTAYMIEQNPNLLNRLRQNKVNRSTKSFEHAKDGSMFKVLSAIAETKHGLSPNFAYVDEVHAHKSSELIDVMLTGTAARRQSLTIYTTTADYDRPSTCNELYERAKRIASGEMSDVSFLPVIYEATVDDDFEDERTWKKANPNYGISIYAEYFERNIRQCKSNPVLLNRFLRLHLNIRTKTETVWIPTWVWANGNHTENHLLSIDEIKTLLYNHRLWHNFAADNEWFNNSQIDLYLTEFQGYFTWYFRKLEELQDVECYGGYDNSSVNDIASFSLYFPSEGVVMPWFWVPAESIYKRSVEERLPYDRWFKSGLINNTPLASISERDIAKTLTGDGNQKGICTYFRNLQLVCFDAWGSNFIYETLYNAGLQAKKYPQSYVGMNGPCRKLQADIENKELFHGSNPVLRWMMGNVTMTTNNNDQMRPNKQKSTDKIDGVVASLMAIGGHMYSGQQMITNISGLREANELESLPTT